MNKKLLVLALLCSTGFFSLYGQASTFEKGDGVLNAGIGLGSALYSGSSYSTSFPPLSVSFEKGIKDEVLEKGVIGVGGYLGYSSYKWEYFGWGWKYTDFIIGARGTFHYPLLEKLDTYTGVLFGLEIVSSKEFGNSIPGYNFNDSAGGFIWSWYAGGRYYLSDKFAVMAELGFGISYLNLGVAVKL